MIKGFIAEINDTWLILETARKQLIRLPRQLMPTGAQLGDFIYEIPDKGVYAIDPKITAARHKQLRQMADSSFD